MRLAGIQDRAAGAGDGIDILLRGGGGGGKGLQEVQGERSPVSMRAGGAGDFAGTWSAASAAPSCARQFSETRESS